MQPILTLISTATMVTITATATMTTSTPPLATHSQS